MNYNQAPQCGHSVAPRLIFLPHDGQVDFASPFEIIEIIMINTTTPRRINRIKPIRRGVPGIKVTSIFVGLYQVALSEVCLLALLSMILPARIVTSVSYVRSVKTMYSSPKYE